MAAVGSGYHSCVGYKLIMPWRAWSGSRTAVATKHAIYLTIQQALREGSTADGWYANVSAIVELEYEVLLAQGLVQPPEHGEEAETLVVRAGLDGRSTSRKGGETEAVITVILAKAEPFHSQSARALSTFCIWAGAPPPPHQYPLHIRCET
eukprot:2973765-Rhodomonas_salina.1